MSGEGQLPDGWAWTTLAKVTDVLDGNRVPVNAKEREARPGTVPYYGATGQVGWIDDYLFDEELILLGEDGVQFFDTTKQKAYLISGKSWVNNHAHVLRAHSGTIDQRLLCHYLNFFDYGGFANGTTRLKLTQGAMNDIPIPLPPLSEQRRIVDALEDHLSRLDAGSQTVAANLRRLKLLRTRLIAEVTSHPHPSKMPTTIGSIARRVRNGIFVSRPGSDPIGVPILRIGAVRPMSLDLTDLRYTGLSANSGEISPSLLESGDLLFTRYNGNPEYVGACAVVPDGIGPLTYPDKLIRVEVDLARAIPRYVALACSAGSSRHFIRQSVKTTAGQAGISGRELKAVPLELPDLTEQQRRIDQFDEADRALTYLDASLRFAFQRAANLRRALLAEAFSGRLVPQGPADEPASEVLARIEAERARLATGKTRPVRRTRTPATTGRAPKATTTVPVGVQEELPL